jgi:hypothetical protein
LITQTHTQSEQRARALELANQVRADIHAVRLELAVGAISLAAALSDPRAASMTVFDLLRSRPRVGPRRARTIAWAAEVNELKRISELTDRQRSAIIEAAR